MQNVKISNQSETLAAKPCTSGLNNLPPAKLWVDSLLDELFPEGPNKTFTVLTPFDYEGFLRKEGLV